MTTSLTLNSNQDSASTIAAASKMVATQTGTTSSGINTKIGTASGTNCWGQIYSKGNAGAWPALSAIGNPDGNGWLQDDTSLELQTIIAGLWQWIEKARITAGTATITLVQRFYKYNPASGGTYTLIGSITLTSCALTSSQATYTSASVSLSAMAFVSGDKLYKDLWGNITANSGAGAGTNFALQTCNNAGLGLSGIAQVTTPGYNPTTSPPALSTAPSVMTFNAYQAGANPASQNTTLSETAGTATAWTSSISYGSGSGWLAISPTSGSLGALGSTSVAFTCTTGSLTAGTYTATVTFTATTGGATATVTVNFIVAPPYLGYTVLIANQSVQIYDDGQYLLDDSIGQASTLMCNVRDDTGSNHYTKGQPVSVTDGSHGLQFTGFVSTAVEDRESPNPLIQTQLGARDNHYLAEKRTYDGPEFTNVPAGAIVCQLLNVLSQEGITASYATERDTTATDFGTGTLTRVVGASNVGDGDLELALTGTQVVIEEDDTAEFGTGSLNGVTAANNTLMPTATNAVKLVATCTQPGSVNAYTYMKIWTGSHAVGANENFSYDVFVLASSPSGQMGVDVLFTDGTNWRDTALIPDIQYVFPHPNNDIGPMGVGQWYHRSFYWGQYSGKTIQSIQVVSEGDAVGVYTGYFKNIQLNTSFYAFVSNTVQQIANNGYGSSLVSIVPTYDLTAAYRYSTAYSIDAAKILQSSMMTWTTVEPAGTLFVLKVSLDGGLTYQTCTKNAPIPYVPAGSNIAGVSLTFAEEFDYDPAVTGSARPGPEVAPVLSALQVIVNPSYSATKTDIVYEVAQNSDWAAGTFTRTTNSGGPDLGLKQFIRNWDNGDVSNQTLFSASAQTSADRQTFHISVPAASGGVNAEARSRIDFAGTIADGTVECDVLIDNASVILSMVYRTTHWENHDLSWAYSIEVTQTTMKLFKGPNSSSYSYTQIGSTASLNISSGNWHRLKIVFVGSSHQAYLDDVLYINQTDGTYTAAGNVALRVSNPSSSASYVGHFDNFGVISSGANLNGTWLSPPQLLTTVGTYATSVLSWRDNSSDPGNTDTLLVETQVDGSTWQTATNGAAIPNLTIGQSLSGVNLSIRVTLTTTTASTSPLIDRIVARIVSQLSSSGNRVSPALALTNVGVLGGSVIAWNNVTLPTGCTLGVDARVDAGSWVDITSSNGGPVPGLVAQGAVTLDSFAANSSSSYTSTHGPSGANASWTWDTSNNRLVASGGTAGLLLYTGLSASDVDIQIILDQADYTGLVWREVDTNNYYFLVIADASSSLSANIMQLFKVSGGVQSQLGSNYSGFSFPRGTVHAVRLTMIGGVITVSFDGTQVFTYTDSSPLGSGGVGLFNSTFSGGSAGRFYSFRVTPQGQNVSSHTIQTRMRLASTNPLATPQVSDLTIAVFGPTIGVGSTIPQTTMFHKYISDNMATCVTASPGYWWDIDKNKVPYFLPQNALPAPWPGSDGGSVPTNGDFLDANITIEDASDLYRNREIVDNVLAPVAINQTFFGDGASTTWTCANQWAAAPLITITNIVTGVASVATVGVLNVDTGKQFYWSLGSNTITEDSTGPLYDFTFSLNFNGAGQYLTYSQYDNTAAQAARALVEGTGTGIVTWTVDGTGLTKAQGDALAQADVNTYSVIGRLLKATTRRYGLQVGQALSLFLPAHGIWNQLFLVRQIKTHLTTEYPTGTAGGAIQQGWYEIEACSGADVGDWSRLYKRVGKPQAL